MNQDYSGNLFIVAAPSGGGKTSLVRQLVTTFDNTMVSISHTTRAPRPGEQDGVDYNFISENTFLTMLNQGDFIEYAQVFNNLYGTSKMQIIENLKRGKDILFDIDWQGAKQLKKIFPDAVTIFILPPSLESLQERLLSRGQDSPDVVRHRMDNALHEISHYQDFEYLILNDNFDKALVELKNIILVNRLRTTRHAKKLQELLSIFVTKK
jgi:guanylate kinase